jgi:hypothetical protein
VLLQQVQKIGAGEQRDGLSRSELVCIRPVISRGNKDASRCALVLHSSKEIANCRYANCARVSLGLNNDLAARNGIGVECHDINAAIDTRLGDFHLTTARGELLFEKFADKVLEIAPIHRC